MIRSVRQLPLDELARARLSSLAGALAAAGALGVGLLVLLGTRGARRLPAAVTLVPSTFTVREIERRDLDFCAALHVETLQHGFFAELGRRFLRGYLATYVSSPHAVALIVTASGEPVGTIVGILRPSAHRSWVLKRHGPQLALLGALALAARPRLAARFARTRLRRYGRALARRSGAAAAPARGEPAVLSHLAVVPWAQGAGLGARLVDAFVEAVWASGARRIVLVTLAGPAGAAGFYERLGWTEVARRPGFDGEPLIEMALEPDAGRG